MLLPAHFVLFVWSVQTRYFATFPNIPGCNRKSFWTGNFTRSGWVLLNWAGSTHLLYCFYVSLLSVDPATEIAKPSKLAAKCRSRISKIFANFEFVKNSLIGQHAFFPKLLTNTAITSAGPQILAKNQNHQSSHKFSHFLRFYCNNTLIQSNNIFRWWGTTAPRLLSGDLIISKNTY